jgi:uncharacterized membrane protein (GlpM family)
MILCIKENISLQILENFATINTDLYSEVSLILFDCFCHYLTFYFIIHIFKLNKCNTIILSCFYAFNNPTFSTIKRHLVLSNKNTLHAIRTYSPDELTGSNFVLLAAVSTLKKKLLFDANAYDTVVTWFFAACILLCLLKNMYWSRLC